MAGDLPADALRKEKIREDRIRATGLRVVRWLPVVTWMWDAVNNPEILWRKLLQAGLRVR